MFDEEINKLAHLEPAASEFNVTRNYLDWLTQIPWGQRSAENFGIKNAMTVLDEDHHGLKDVKDRILEFIAVGKLRGTVEGRILCFVGPPVSVKRALGRVLPGLSIVNITGSALEVYRCRRNQGPPKNICWRFARTNHPSAEKCQTENPLILIDEIDKVGRGTKETQLLLCWNYSTLNRTIFPRPLSRRTR